MSTDNPNQDPFAVPGGAQPQQPQQQQQNDPFAVPAGDDPFAAPAGDDPFAAPHIERGSWVPHRGSKIMTFAILGVAVPLGIPFSIVAWKMGSGDLKRIRDGEMDPTGRGVTIAGKIVGTVATFANPAFWALQIISIAAEHM
jgi:hypothetical protein